MIEGEGKITDIIGTCVTQRKKGDGKNIMSQHIIIERVT